MADNAVSSPFDQCKVGINPFAFDALLTTYLSTATDDQCIAARQTGLHHWPYLSARNNGVLDVSIRHAENAEGRYYAVGSFPLTSLPSVMRPAVTSPFDGHRVLYVDVRSSHFRVAANMSGDTELANTLNTSPGLYAEIAALTGETVKHAKVGLNIWNNGGGVECLEQAGIQNGESFLEECKHLFLTKYSKAGAWMNKAAKKAFEKGYAKKEHAAKGVALMRREAEFLTLAGHWVNNTEGAFVMLPMHDGLLVSVADDAVAAEVVTLVARAFAPNIKDASIVVSHSLSDSWEGNVKPLVGHALRVRAMNVHRSDSPAGSREWGIAHQVLDPHFATRKAPRGKVGDSMRRCQEDTQAAASWSNAHRVRAKYGTDPIQLPDNKGTGADLYYIVTTDPVFPSLALCCRTGNYLADGKPVESLEAWCDEVAIPFIEDRYGWQPRAIPDLFTHVANVARRTLHDPVKDYLDGLTWDGVPRLATWLTDYLPCEDTPLHRAYGEKTILGAVKRVYEPGCQHDTILTIVGDQGAHKTRLLATLAPLGSFASVDLNPDDRDKVYRASRPMFVEWGEFSGMTRREQEALKDYITKTEDRLRLPYGRDELLFPRRNVFFATTNDRDFLRDATGSRRYWPVEVTGVIDLDKIRAVKDQLWAEAVAVYKGAPDAEFLNWLPADLEDERAERAVDFEEDDPVNSAVMAALTQMYPHGGEVMVTMRDVMDFLMVKPADQSRVNRSFGRALRAIGFVRSTQRHNGKIQKVWTGDLPPINSVRFLHVHPGHRPATTADFGSTL